MKSNFCPKTLLSLTLALYLVPAAAQANFITFDFVGVGLSTFSEPMTGSFEWTYDPADFGDGSGQMITFSSPGNPGISELNITIDNKSIDLSLIKNLDSTAFDVNIKFVGVLSATQPVAINLSTSKYEIGVNKGTFVSGSIVPRAVPEPTSLGLFSMALVVVGCRRTRRRETRAE